MVENTSIQTIIKAVKCHRYLVNIYQLDLVIKSIWNRGRKILMKNATHWLSPPQIFTSKTTMKQLVATSSFIFFMVAWSLKGSVSCIGVPLNKFHTCGVLFSLAGVFYNVKNGSSFITSKSSSESLSNQNKHFWRC